MRFSRKKKPGSTSSRPKKNRREIKRTENLLAKVEFDDYAGFFRGGKRFIGVWKYGDTGDVAPWAILNYSPVTNIPGSRLALNPDGADLIAGGDGQVSVYHLPEIFKKTE